MNNAQDAQRDGTRDDPIAIHAEHDADTVHRLFRYPTHAYTRALMEQAGVEVNQVHGHDGVARAFTDVLDGNVRAFMSGGSLILQGDAQANEILIEQTAPRQFTVSSRDGSTTINGARVDSS